MFLGTISLFSTMTIAQTDPPPPDMGGGGSSGMICCQLTGAFCTDRFGNAYSDSIEKPGPYCP